tara:strand:- start:159 stop:758 length:600 start_codon:yes stop_codon:yes gene_type:complete
MHKGKKHEEMSVMDAYNDFARSEGAEAKKYVDSIRKNNPFAKGVDEMMDEESRRRERGYYVKGTMISKGKKVDTPDDGMSRKSMIGGFTLPHQGMSRVSSPLSVDPFAKKKPATEEKNEKLKTSVLYGTKMKERKSHYEADKPGSNYFMRKKEKQGKALSPSMGMSRASSPLSKDRCWDGYEPTPGVKAYEPGSCRKIK